MIRDPHYRAILDRLSATGLDPDAFERCALDLLRDIYPRLTPVEGGSDLGMDGLDTSDPDEQMFLVATTAKDVRSNLLTSLRSHKRQSESIGARRVVVATSQPATGSLHERLRETATGEGFQLVNLHGLQAFADLLYRSSHWTRELFGLSGAPSALSAVPLSSRPMSDLPLIGRDVDRGWLANSTGDIVVSGHPASGKTHLLRQFVDQGWLFMVDANREPLTNAVRHLDPEVVVVDDAHADLDGLRSLRQLRSAIDADFRIAAVTWTGHKDEVMDALAVSGNSALDLQLLSRDEILEVVKAVGIAGPVELQRAIVNQSGGRPGLTATLCDTALRGDMLALLSGDSLLRDIKVAVGRIDGSASMDVLAIMALSGDSGASLVSVAAVLASIGSSSPNIRRLLIQLGHIGVFRILTLDGKATIWPRELRFALVGDTFFSSIGYQNIPLEIVADHLDKRGVTGSLVGASLMGAQIPEQTIEDFLMAGGSVDDFKGYARVGPRQASFVLRARPEWLPDVAPHSLLKNPIETLPMLLARAVGDRRPLHSSPAHPLRILEDWVESASFSDDEQLERRRLLANAADIYSNADGDPQVVIQALCSAMNPKYESSNMDAGSGHAITIKSGLVERNCLNGLTELWPIVLESIPTEGPEDYSMLFGLLHDWAYCGRSQKAPPDDVREMMRSHAKNLATDLASRFSDHPGILSEIREFVSRSELEVSISVSKVFSILYPDPDYEALAKDSDGQHHAWREDARKLAAELEPRGPQEALAMVGEAVKAAAEAGRSWPDMTGDFAEEIAGRTDEPYGWATQAVDEDMESLVVEPLLRAARREDQERCCPLVVRAIDSAATQYAAVRVVLTAEAPLDEELEAALDALPRIPYMHNLVRGVVMQSLNCVPTLRLLLQHPSVEVAEITAVNLRLYGADSRVPDPLFGDWREAILRSHGVEYMLSGILKSDASLFCEWIIERIESGISSETHEFIRHLDNAFEELSFSQREEILFSMRGKNDFYFAPIVAKVVGEHAEILEVLLSMECLRDYHDAGFVSASNSKIIVASKAGWSPIRIAQAIASPAVIFTIFHGPESNHWQTWLEYFAKLSESADLRVAAVGQAGGEWARRNVDDAGRSERDREVYGDSLC